MLEKIMQDLFLDCFNLKDGQDSKPSHFSSLKNEESKIQMRHVLKSYALLSKQRLAEQLYTDNVVKPFTDQYINESYLVSNIRRLNGVFEKILEFIDQNSEFLKQANEIKSSFGGQQQQHANEIETSSTTNEFDFVLNSIWSHIVACLDLNLNVIFSPADPDLFHANFTLAFDFLAKFEAKCSPYDKDLKRKLLNAPTYKYFVKKWPVQVYYQIRFQEIVSRFEDDLIDYGKMSEMSRREEEHEDDEDEQNQIGFYLNVTESLVKQMELCWIESKCFLKCLLSQFWKLNLQLISRYCMFFINLFQKKLQTNNENSNNAAVTAAASQENSQTTMIQSVSNRIIFEDDLNLCVLVINDADKLLSLKLPNFFDGVIAPAMRSSNAIKEIPILKEAFNSSTTNISQLQSFLIDFIVQYQTEKCLSHLKNANDIPRLYRRTNREIPKFASNYINLTVEVISEFRQTHGNSKKPKCQQELVEKCIQNIIDSICLKYQSIASDLLKSVKKMEDSLRKLQRVRHSNKSNANMGSSMTSSVVSDDDKIRIQLHIDIVEFGRLLAEKFNGYKGDSNYEALFKLVEEINVNVSNITNNSLESGAGGGGLLSKATTIESTDETGVDII